MASQHETSIKRLYNLWLAGDVATIEREFSPKLTFEIKGKTLISGKHDRTQFGGLITRMKDLSGGTFHSEIHDMLVSDRHAMVLATHKLTRAGSAFEYRSVQVWRFEEGSPIAGYEYLRDHEQFQQIWGAIGTT
jgi:ketosteroid isomerase-like protein